MRIEGLSADTFWKGEVRVSGLVTDGKEQHKARIYVKGSQVYDYSCSCVAGNSYRGMCPHCEALLKEFKEREGELKKQPVSTSQGVRFMIRDYTDRAVARARGLGEERKVGLEPRLTLSGRKLKLELKVGRERKYMVRDLAAFAEAVERGRTAGYGKGLSFCHSREAFEETSKPLLDFVLEQAAVYKSYYEQFSHASYLPPQVKALELNPAGCSRLMELLENRIVEFIDAANPHEKRRLLVCMADPAFKVTVRRDGRDGVRVEVPQDILVFFGEQDMYVADKSFLYLCSPEFTEAASVFLEHMILTYGASRQVTVNDRDMPQFYETVLKGLAPFGLLDTGTVDLSAYRPEPLEAVFAFSSPGEDTVWMVPELSYGESRFNPVVGEPETDRFSARQVVRDRAGEIRIEQAISKYFKYRETDGSLVIRGDEDIYRLLDSGMEEFLSLGRVELAEDFEKMRVLPPPKVSLGVTLKSGWLDLTVEADGMTGEELSGLLREYRQKKTFYRMKSGAFLTLGDDGLMTVARLMEGLSLDDKELKDGHLSLPGNRAMYLDSVMKEGRQISYYRDSLFKAVVRGMKSVEDSDYPVPAGLSQVLRGYQKTGFRWLKTLDEWGFGGILADDMGIGKTLQILALLEDEAKRQSPGSAGRMPSLVVCPASLVYNWESEIERFVPGLKFCVVDGTASERREMLERAGEYELLVTSYDLLKRDISLYEGIQFRYQVADEAQFIKNAATQSARAVKKIRAVTRFALTGTPVENRLGELWSIFDYLMPGFLFGYQKFRRVFELPILKAENQETLENLRKLTAPFILRRLKKDVLKDLPDKLETVVYSRFEGEQKALYAANARKLKMLLEKTDDEDYAGERMQILAELTRLRQICCDPSLCYENYGGGSAKLDTCLQLLEEAVESGHKVLLFSQFTSMLEIIGKRLSEREIPFHRLIGSTPKEERAFLTESFKTDDVKVFLISLKAGGTGLNLTAADIVIHFDPWWNVAAQNQATDRAYRIGQKKQVIVFRLIAKHTVEENILKLQESKRLLAEQVISEGMVSPGSLSREDILKLLGE